MVSKARRKHPEVPLKDIRNQVPPESDTSKAGVDKKATMLRLADAEGSSGSEQLSQSTFVPTDEQIAKINTFTQRSVTSDEVACFTTLSCNDLVDRDDDQFVTETVKGLASLPPPYSPTGKSFMVSHDTSKLAVGRIFDTGTTTVKMPDGTTATFLTNDVYIPRTDANKTFIENQEYGINWAVSVGVLLGDAKCAVGKEHDWGFWPWFCTEGHDKGMSYDPDSDEEDSWGYPLPVAEGAKNSQKCIRKFYEPRDMYELSQVYLGAQYFAEIAKSAGIEPIVKAASAKHIPILGLRSGEAKGLHLPELPKSLRKAARNNKVQEDEGSFSWTDESGLVWRFTPGVDGDPLCLGKAAKPTKMDELKERKNKALAKFDKIKAEKDTAGAAALAGQLQGSFNELQDAINNDDDETTETLMDRIEDLVDQLFDELYESDSAEEDPNDNIDDDSNDPAKAAGGDMSKKAVLAALKKSSIPTAIVEKVERAEEAKAFEVFVAEVSATMASQSIKAAAGSIYLKELRAEVIDMYVKSKTPAGGANGGVDISSMERILKHVDDDPEALKDLRDEYKAAFLAKFPAPVRRSTVESDHNDPGVSVPINRGDIETRIDSASVKHWHG